MVEVTVVDMVVTATVAAVIGCGRCIVVEDAVRVVDVAGEGGGEVGRRRRRGIVPVAGRVVGDDIPVTRFIQTEVAWKKGNQIDG